MKQSLGVTPTVADAGSGKMAAVPSCTASGTPSSRDLLAADYFKALRALTHEMDAGMAAIARNALVDFEESVGKQAGLCARLKVLVRGLAIRADGVIQVTGLVESGRVMDGRVMARNADEQTGIRAPALANELVRDVGYKQEIKVAGEVLRARNDGYFSLVKHAGRSNELLSSLCASYTGQGYTGRYMGQTNKGACGAGHQTWHCEV